MELTKEQLDQLMTDRANAALGTHQVEITKQMAAQTQQVVDLRNDISKELSGLKEKFGPMAEIEKNTRLLAEEKMRSKISKLTPDQTEVFMAMLIKGAGQKQDQWAGNGAYKRACDILSDVKRNPDGLDLVLKSNYQNATTSADGLYGVPTLTMGAILDLVYAESVALKYGGMFPLPPGAKVRNQPIALGGAAVYYPGEAAATTISKTVFGTLSITPILRAAITILTREVLTFSNSISIEFIIRQLAKAFARDTDAKAFADTGTVMTAGLRTSTALVASTIAASTFAITADELIAVPSAISDAAAVGELRWFMNNSVWWKFMANLKATSGGVNYIFQNMWNSKDKNPLGYELVNVHNAAAMYAAGDTGASKCFALFGDMDAALKIGTIGVDMIETTTEAAIVDSATTRSMFQDNEVAVKMSGFIGMGIPDYATGASIPLYPMTQITSNA